MLVEVLTNADWIALMGNTERQRRWANFLSSGQSCFCVVHGDNEKTASTSTLLRKVFYLSESEFFAHCGAWMSKAAPERCGTVALTAHMGTLLGKHLSNRRADVSDRVFLLAVLIIH